MIPRVTRSKNLCKIWFYFKINLRRFRIIKIGVKTRRPFQRTNNHRLCAIARAGDHIPPSQSITVDTQTVMKGSM